MQKKLLDWIKSICDTNDINIQIDNAYNVLFNVTGLPKKHIVNFVLVVMKQYLYRCRCNNTKPHVKAFENEIYYIQRLELFNAKNENKVTSHTKRWSPILTELDSTVNDPEPL